MPTTCFTLLYAYWRPVHEGQRLPVEGVGEKNLVAQRVLERDDGRATVQSHDAKPAHIRRWSAARDDDVLVEGSEWHPAPAQTADAPGRHAVEVGGALLTGKLLQVADRHVGGVRHGTRDVYLGMGRDLRQALQRPSAEPWELRHRPLPGRQVVAARAPQKFAQAEPGTPP
jgi:hypothetical protein